MNYYELNKDEQDILDAVENGEFKSKSDTKGTVQDVVKIAKNTLNKTTNINIRLSEKDVYKLKAKAAKQGLPYQTLVASILHQSTN